MAIAKKPALLIMLLSFPAFAMGDEDIEVIDRAKACAMAGDYDCSFTVLIELFEETDVPFVSSEGHPVLVGSMLEASLILGEHEWGDTQAMKNAHRYLDVLNARKPNGIFGVATGHAIIARSCFDLGDLDCAGESVAFMCANSKRLASPMLGHPRYETFVSQTAKMLNRECGVPQ